MQRIILHIDFDSFFASVEQQYHPEFRGKPLGVTARNGRNCIIAASREAKKLGIGTGSRRHDALKLCPTLLFVPADFNKYWKISQHFVKICTRFSPFVEVFSIDELFMDATMTAHLFGGVEGLIQKLKKQIREEIGEYITVSVGISHNKLLAKLGSGLKKPDGVFSISPPQVPYVYAKAKLQDICGIGWRIEARLNQMGIYTLLQLSRTPLSALVAEFGNVEGHFLYDVGRGVDGREIHPFQRVDDAKSVSRNYCLPENEYDSRVVFQNVYELYEELGIKLRRLNKTARHIGMSLRGKNNFGIHKTFQYYVDTGKEMFDSIVHLLFINCHPEQVLGSQFTHQQMLKQVQYDFTQLGYVRQISVWVSFLRDKHATAQNVFYNNENYGKVIRVVDKINDTFGDHTIRNGFLLYADKLTTVPNGYMADRYERVKLATSSI